MKKLFGAGLTIGYVLVMAFQVYAFHYYLGFALENYWKYKYNCTEPGVKAASSLSSSAAASFSSQPVSAPLSQRPSKPLTPLTFILQNSRPQRGKAYGVYVDGILEELPSSKKADSLTTGAKSRRSVTGKDNGVSSKGSHHEYEQEVSSSLKDSAASQTNTDDSKSLSRMSISEDTKRDDRTISVVNVDNSSNSTITKKSVAGNSTKQSYNSNNMRRDNSTSSSMRGGDSSNNSIVANAIVRPWAREGNNSTHDIYESDSIINTTMTTSQFSHKYSQDETKDHETASSGPSTHTRADSPVYLITAVWKTSGGLTTPKSEAVAGSNKDKLSSIEKSSRSTDKPGPRKGKVRLGDCQMEYGFVFPKIALMAQFVTALGLGLATYLFWMVAIYEQESLYHLSVVALLTAVTGFLSTVSWSEGMASGEFEKQWQFWPYVCSYAYVVLAVIPLLATHVSSASRGPSQFRMTENEWLRWQRVQQRRQQVDDLLEAAGGGDVIYSHGSDGSWRVCRWDSGDDSGQAPQLQTTTADVEATAPDSGALADPSSNPQSRSSTDRMGTNHVLLVIPGNDPLMSAARVSGAGRTDRGAAPAALRTSITKEGQAHATDKSQKADRGDGRPRPHLSTSSATMEEKSFTLALSEEVATPGPLDDLAETPSAADEPAGLAHPAESDVKEQENEMDQNVLSESSPLLLAEGSAAGDGGKGSKYGGTL